ncbi:MAG: hypothetical protein QOH43_3077 [Solirubrobacteraceae bacterium]|jgi:uncharacterized protein YndB with AHSA1/START domain|nr:hypothetical protein [Solirubrobacteraceae bacterium]
MRAHHIRVQRDFDLPVAELFEHLSEHERLADVFGARIERLRDGDTDRNGVGSVRRLHAPGLPAFEETVTAFTPPELIVYRITKGTPLDDHEGVMRFSARPGGGSHLDYDIMLASRIPGLTLLVSKLLGVQVRRGLAGIDGASA